MNDARNLDTGPASTEPARLSDDAMAMMRFDAEKKSVLVAYLLWFFLGVFGVHRFYLGSTGWGIAIVVLFLAGFVTLFITWIPMAIILFVDLFLIPGIAQRRNVALAQHLGMGRPSV